MKRTSLVLLGFLLAAGCESEYAPTLEDLELGPADIGRAMLGRAAVTSAATTGEKKTFQIDLAMALAVAGARSVEVRLAQAKEDEARQAIYAAFAVLVPVVTPEILMNVHRDNLQTSSGPFEKVDDQFQYGGATASAYWEPGQVVFGALAAERRTDAAQAHTDTARADNALAVAEAYYWLVRARALVQIADQALEEARTLEHDNDARERRGAGIRADVLRAQAEVAQKELARTQAEAEVAVTSARLAALLQLEPEVELVPAEDMPLPIVLVSNGVPLRRLLDKAATARPELRESQMLIAASVHEREGVTWGPLVPQANLGVSTGVLGPTFGQGIGDKDYAAGVGWKIGPGGLLDLPAINAAAARVQQTRIQDEGLRVDIAREVVEARANAVAADGELVSARNGVVAAAEALRLSKLRYEKGATIELEVLDALSAFTTARTSEVQAIVDLNRAQYRLLRAIGEPIEMPGPPR